MTRWFAWFQDNDDRKYFRIVAAEALDIAIFIAADLALREQVTLIGVISAEDSYNCLPMPSESSEN